MNVIEIMPRNDYSSVCLPHLFKPFLTTIISKQSRLCKLYESRHFEFLTTERSVVGPWAVIEAQKTIARKENDDANVQCESQRFDPG